MRVLREVVDMTKSRGLKPEARGTPQRQLNGYRLMYFISIL